MKTQNLRARALAASCAWLILASALAPSRAARAADPPADAASAVSTDAKAVGATVKHDAKVVADAAKDGAQQVAVAAKEVAHEVATAAKEGATAAKEGAQQAAAAAKHGAEQTKAAVTGDKAGKTDKPEKKDAKPASDQSGKPAQ